MLKGMAIRLANFIRPPRMGNQAKTLYTVGGGGGEGFDKFSIMFLVPCTKCFLNVTQFINCFTQDILFL